MEVKRVLGTEPQSCARIISALNFWAVSPSQSSCLSFPSSWDPMYLPVQQVLYVVFCLFDTVREMGKHCLCGVYQAVLTEEHWASLTKAYTPFARKATGTSISEDSRELIFLLKDVKCESVCMSQILTVEAGVKKRAPRFSSSTHKIHIYNSSSRKLDALFWHLQTPGMNVVQMNCAYMCMHTHQHSLKHCQIESRIVNTHTMVTPWKAQDGGQ